MMRQTASLWAKIATQKSLLRGKNVLTLEHVRAVSPEDWNRQWLTDGKVHAKEEGAEPMARDHTRHR